MPVDSAKLLVQVVTETAGEQNLRRQRDEIEKLSRAYKGLVGQVASLDHNINVLGAGIRQIGQAFQNFGMVLSLFVTAPVTKAISSAVSGFVEFDAAIIEARKSADLTADSMAALAKAISDISAFTPTPREELAKLAAEAGRLGIRGVENITAFVKIIDQLQVATELTADESARAIGRLTVLFEKQFRELEKEGKTFEDFLSGIGSAINEIERNVAAGAGEIVSAALRIAPAATALGLTVEETIALAGSIAQVSASAERGGTQVNRALSQIAVQAEKLAKSMGVSLGDLSAVVQEGPTEAFLALADAIAKVEDPLKRAAIAQEVFGATGAKAIQALGANMQEVAQNVAIARSAFESGTSLSLEFALALDSLQAQFGLLRNNLSLLASDVMTVLKPVISDVIALAIPTIQEIRNVLDELGPVAKRNVVLAAIAMAAAGPALFALGSLMFSIGIATTGLTTLMVLVINLTRNFAGLYNIIRIITNPITLMASAFGLVISTIVLGVENTRKMVAQLGDLALAAFDWGHNVISAFADGMMAAGTAVVNAVISIIDAIAGFLQGFSPPKKGPLSKIDRWGENVARAFLDGFAKASTEPIRRFAGIISEELEGALRTIPGSAMRAVQSLQSMAGSIIDAMERTGLISGDAAIGAAEQVTTLIARFFAALETGADNAGEILAKIGESLGRFGTDFAELVRQNAEYLRLNEELERVRRRLADLDKDEERRLRAIALRKDLTSEQKAALIRAERLRTAKEREALTEEEQSLRDQLSAIQESIQGRESFIRIILGLMDRLRTEAGEAGEKPKKPKKEDLFDIPISGLEDLKDRVGEFAETTRQKIDSLTEGTGEFVKKLSESTEKVKGFFAAIRGETVDLSDKSAAFAKGFDIGQDVRQRLLNFLTSAKRRVNAVSSAIKTAKTLLTGFKNSAEGAFSKTVDEILPDDAGAKLAEAVNAAVTSFVQNLDPEGELKRKLSLIGAPFESLAAILGNIIDLSAQVSESLGTKLGEALAEGVNTVLTGILAAVGAVGTIVEFLNILAFGPGERTRERLEKNLGLISQDATGYAETIENAAERLRQAGSTVSEFVSNMASASLSKAKEVSSWLFGDEQQEGIISRFVSIPDVSDASQKLTDAGKAVKNFITTVGKTPWQRAKSLWTWLFGSEKTEGAWQRLKNNSAVQAIVSAIRSIAAALEDLASKLATETWVTAKSVWTWFFGDEQTKGAWDRIKSNENLRNIKQDIDSLASSLGKLATELAAKAWDKAKKTWVWLFGDGQNAGAISNIDVPSIAQAATALNNLWNAVSLVVGYITGMDEEEFKRKIEDTFGENSPLADIDQSPAVKAMRTYSEVIQSFVSKTVRALDDIMLILGVITGTAFSVKIGETIARLGGFTATVRGFISGVLGVMSTASFAISVIAGAALVGLLLLAGGFANVDNKVQVLKDNLNTFKDSFEREWGKTFYDLRDRIYMPEEEEGKERADEILERIKEKGYEAGDGAAYALAKMKELWEWLTKPFTEAWEQGKVGGFLGTALGSFMSNLAALPADALNAIGNLLLILDLIMKGDWQTALEILKSEGYVTGAVRGGVATGAMATPAGMPLLAAIMSGRSIWDYIFGNPEEEAGPSKAKGAPLPLETEDDVLNLIFGKTKGEIVDLFVSGILGVLQDAKTKLATATAPFLVGAMVGAPAMATAGPVSGGILGLSTMGALMKFLFGRDEAKLGSDIHEGIRSGINKVHKKELPENKKTWSTVFKDSILGGLADWLQREVENKEADESLSGKGRSIAQIVSEAVDTWLEDNLYATYDTIKEKLSSWITENVNVLKEHGNNIASWIIAGIAATLQNVKSTFSTITTKLGEWIAEAFSSEEGKEGIAWQKAKDIGKRLLDGIKKGIEDAWETFKTWFENLLDSIFGGWFENKKPPSDDNDGNNGGNGGDGGGGGGSGGFGGTSESTRVITDTSTGVMAASLPTPVAVTEDNSRTSVFNITVNVDNADEKKIAERITRELTRRVRGIA